MFVNIVSINVWILRKGFYFPSFFFLVSHHPNPILYFHDSCSCLVFVNAADSFFFSFTTMIIFIGLRHNEIMRITSFYKTIVKHRECSFIIALVEMTPHWKRSIEISGERTWNDGMTDWRGKKGTKKKKERKVKREFMQRKWRRGKRVG